MPYTVFSEEWIDAWAAEIRASEEYRRAAGRWEWPLTLVLRAAPGRAGPGDRHVYLDLRRGECREARLGGVDDEARAEFVLSANAAAWKEVLEGALDPIAGVMQGRIRVEKGSVMKLAMHAAAAKALVATAARVDTHFPEAL